LNQPFALVKTDGFDIDLSTSLSDGTRCFDLVDTLVAFMALYPKIQLELDLPPAGLIGWLFFPWFVRGPLLFGGTRGTPGPG
jgi:hypothetical protein